MKTRIKKIEYCNGKIDYVCQRMDIWNALYYLLLLFPIFGWIIIIAENPKIWEEIDKNYNNPDTIYCEPATFDELLSAQKFMQEYCAYIEIIEKQAKKQSKKIKSVTYIKHP